MSKPALAMASSHRSSHGAWRSIPRWSLGVRFPPMPRSEPVARQDAFAAAIGDVLS